MAKVFQCDRCHEVGGAEHGQVRISDEHTSNKDQIWELCKNCYRTIADELAHVPAREAAAQREGQ